MADRAPAASTGPFFIVMNAGSGSRSASERQATIAQRLQAAGREHEFVLLGEGHDFAQRIDDAVGRARARGGIVVAAGGDGTINAVAQALLGSAVTMGVLPLGTFNYLARANGIPEVLDDAIDVLLDGGIRPIQVGLVNDRVFLVNASLGLYPRLMKQREADKQRYGRRRFVAVLSAVRTLSRKHRELLLAYERDGRQDLLRTPSLFISNNRLQLEDVGLPEAPAAEQGRLVAGAARSESPWRLLWLMVRGAFGRLAGSPDVVTFTFERLRVRPRMRISRRGMQVGRDGEVQRMQPPLEFRVAPQRLPLIVPRAAAGDVPADAS